MENNLWKKMFGSKEGDKSVVDVEFNSDEGQLLWREKYSDGSVNLEWHSESLDIGNPEASKQRMDEIRSMFPKEEQEAA
jgi:hypothetical protein